MPLLTILTPCRNEEGNVREVDQQVKAALQTVPGYDYEHLFIDNASKDKTVGDTARTREGTVASLSS